MRGLEDCLYMARKCTKRTEQEVGDLGNTVRMNEASSVIGEKAGGNSESSEGSGDYWNQ